MYYLNYVNRLQERGLHATNVKELTHIRVEPHRVRPHKRITLSQLNNCLNIVKHCKYGLMKVLDMFPDCEPNEIYRHIKAQLQPFNASTLLKELILTLIRDGVPIGNINTLIKPITDTLPSNSALSHLAVGVNLTRSRLSFTQRQTMLIEIIKYIKHKGIAQDYSGYFLLRTLFPEAESRVVASAIVKSIDHIVKQCSLCGSDFLTSSKHVLFCDKCRKKQRAV